MDYLFFLLCDLHDFHLFFGSVIRILKAEKCKILFDYYAQKELKCF
jgi:heme/copper-type cytochrome/quinol oxidase subunit 3